MESTPKHRPRCFFDVDIDGEKGIYSYVAFKVTLMFVEWEMQKKYSNLQPIKSCEKINPHCTL